MNEINIIQILFANAIEFQHSDAEDTDFVIVPKEDLEITDFGCKYLGNKKYLKFEQKFLISNNK